VGRRVGWEGELLSRAFVAIVALVCTSCAVGVAGTPVADPNGPLTTRVALGDLPTVDFCSLLSADNYPANLGSVVNRPSPSFSYCTMSVISRKTDASVLVGYLSTATNLSGITLDPDRSLSRGLEVRKSRSDSTECERFVRFPDDLYLEVSATAYTSGDNTDWCPLVDATVDRVVDRLTTKQVKHFSFAPGSLGRADACTLLDQTLVEDATGLNPAEQFAFPGAHVCEWNLPRFGYVTVNFTMDESLTQEPADETIAGRRTRITPDTAGLAECALVTSHGFSPESSGDELVNLSVLLPDKGKDACAVARTLPSHAWQKLP
jgi:hypothetical protein